MEVDDALLKLGKFNRWRIATYCMVCCSVTVTGCWHMMAIVFVGKFRCCHSILFEEFLDSTHIWGQSFSEVQKRSPGMGAGGRSPPEVGGLLHD